MWMGRRHHTHHAATVVPALTHWSGRYQDLREVTRDDIAAYLHPLSRPSTQLRDDRAAGTVRLGQAPQRRLPIIPPRASPTVLCRTASGSRWVQGNATEPSWPATTPQARLYVTLAAVHAGRPGQIRALQLDDVDLVYRRITIAGNERPLDDLAHQALLDWLNYWRRRWPNIVNPHLLISLATALGHGPVSQVWICGCAAHRPPSTGRVLTGSSTKLSPPAVTRCTGPPCSPSATPRRSGTPPTPERS